MNKALPLLFACGLLHATAASAQTPAPVDRLIQSLAGAGYTIERVERTWLGRYRIEAERDGFEREIVIDPRNGLILRDILEPDDEDDEDGGDEDRGTKPPADPAEDGPEDEQNDEEDEDEDEEEEEEEEEEEDEEEEDDEEEEEDDEDEEDDE